MIKSFATCLGLLYLGGFAGYQLANTSSVTAVKEIGFTEQWRKAYEADDFVALWGLYTPNAWLMASV